jgi:hypothetical protein
MVRFIKWLTLGIGVKRWLLLLLIGSFLAAEGMALLLLKAVDERLLDASVIDQNWLMILAILAAGFGLPLFAVISPAMWLT